MNVSLNATSNRQYQLSGVNQTSKNQTSENKAQQKNKDEDKYSSVSKYGDTVELSSEGKSMLASQKTEEESDTASELAQIVSDSGAVSSSDSTDETTSSSLSSYSESELKEMYNDGEITASEYAQEIHRRKQASEAKQAEEKAKENEEAKQTEKRNDDTENLIDIAL